jgi:dCMP deaminase
VNNTDLEYLRQAYLYAATWSDDPDTQNGAVLVSTRGYVVCGANRFPFGVNELPERLSRPSKYLYLEHAERDAVYAAAMSGIVAQGSTLYCPWFACPDCARAIIQSGIARVVGHDRPISMTPERWVEPIEVAKQMLAEAGVKMDVIGGETGVAIRFDGQTVVM